MTELTGNNRAKPTVEQINSFRSVIKEICGLDITPEKGYLIEQRLEPILGQNKLTGFGELLTKLENSMSILLRDQVVAAITTQETSFFRDIHPYTSFQLFLLPWLADLIKRRKYTLGLSAEPKVRIWSAGTATGQEAYSLAIAIIEFCKRKNDPGLHPVDFSILGTDISPAALRYASRGIYTDAEINRGLPKYYRDTYFQEVPEGWKVNAKTASLVKFERANLMQHFSLLGPFDIIFCRNVLIYFSNEAKDSIVAQFHRILEPDGYVVLGSSEMLKESNSNFLSVRSGSTLLYKKINGNNGAWKTSTLKPLS